MGQKLSCKGGKISDFPYDCSILSLAGVTVDVDCAPLGVSDPIIAPLFQGSRTVHDTQGSIDSHIVTFPDKC